METNALLKTPKAMKSDIANKSKQSEEKSNLKSIITSSKSINDKQNSKRNQTTNSTSKRTRGVTPPRRLNLSVNNNQGLRPVIVHPLSAPTASVYAGQSRHQHQQMAGGDHQTINGVRSSRSATRLVNCEPNCPQSHSFMTDVTDVRQMEQGLLQLLDDFHDGKLQAFGHDITFEKMEAVREQQERLARLHFDLNAQQEIYGHDSDEGRSLAKENMSKLMDSLQQLSNSIEQLQSKFSGFGLDANQPTPKKEKTTFRL